MGGKTSTSTQQVTIPPEVLAQYQQVNQRAEQTANTPFQTYGGEFVAPVNSTEQGGINQVTSNSNAAAPYYTQASGTLEGAQAAATPYYSTATGDLGAAANAGQQYIGAATGLAGSGTQAVNPGQLDVNQYLSPYLYDVAAAQEGLLNLQNQQQMSGELGNIIQSGAFGGDRAGIDLSNLAMQQDLANNQILSNILNTGYNTALGAAQQQQGVSLEAGQANRAATQWGAGEMASLGAQDYGQGLATSQQEAQLGQDVYGTGAATSAAEAALGTGAQNAAISGGQAALGAGQVQQQTQQALDAAQYNQFLQQQSYPFQVDQFLANIAEGTGSLSGSTTTTTQPGGLFSDERLKEDVHEIGKLNDGQRVYTFRYKGDPTVRMGLMAGEVEKKHPEAVGLAGGYKTVDYGAATADARRDRRASGGGLGLAVANDGGGDSGDLGLMHVLGLPGGGLLEALRGGFASGGTPGSSDLMAAILANEQGMFGPYLASTAGASPASGPGGPYGGSGRVPAANVPVNRLTVASALAPQPSTLDRAEQLAKLGSQAGNFLNSDTTKKAAEWAKEHFGGLGGADASGSGVTADYQPLDLNSINSDAAVADLPSAANDAAAATDLSGLFRRGGSVRRYASGGLAGGYDTTEDDPLPYEDPTPGHLDIPNTPSSAKLATAPGLGGKGGSAGNSTIGQIGQLAGTANSLFTLGSDIAEAAPEVLAFLGLKRGGRAARAGGGSVLNLNDILKEIDAVDNDTDIASLPAAKLPPDEADADIDPALQIAKSVTSASPGSPQSSPMSDLHHAFFAQESGGNPHIRNSLKGAIGIGQIMPATFAMFAQPGEDIHNPEDNARVASRMLDYYAKIYGGDVGRIATAYFSGPGNVAPAGNPTPWRQNRSDGQTLTSDYVASILKRMGKARGGFADGGAPDDDSQDASDVGPSPDEDGGASAAGLGAAAPPPAEDGADQTPPADSSEAPSGHGHLGLKQLEGAWDHLKKPDVWVPLLTGLAAAGSAPTSHLATALEVGLGAGAQSYQRMREYELERQRVAQQQQQIGIAQQLATFRTGKEFDLHRQQLGATLASQFLPVFDAQYLPNKLGHTDASGAPVVWTGPGGEEVTNDEFYRRRSGYLAGQLAPWGLQDVAKNLAAKPASAAAATPTPASAAATTPHAGGTGVAPTAESPAGGPPPAALARPSPAATPHFAAPKGLRPGSPEYKAATGEYETNITHDLPAVDEQQIDPQYRPSALKERIRVLRSVGEDAQANELQKQLEEIQSGEMQPLGVNGQPYTGYVSRAGFMKQNQAQIQPMLDAGVKNTSDASTFFSPEGYESATQILDAMNEIYRANDFGALSPQFAHTISQLRSIPGVGDMLSQGLKQFQGAYDDASKQAARSTIIAAMEDAMSHKAPASVIGITKDTIPTPDKSPDARYDLAAQSRALLEQRKAFYTFWNQYKDRITDAPRAQQDWFAAHPISQFMDQAFVSTPFYAGMTDAKKQQRSWTDPRTGAVVTHFDHLPRGAQVRSPSGHAMYWNPDTRRLSSRPVT